MPAPKNWYEKFETAAWKADPALVLTSASARGVWIELIVTMMQLKSDRVTGTETQLSKLARVTDSELASALDEYREHDVCDVKSNDNGTVTVVSRYLNRKKIQQETSRNQVSLRVQRFRDRHGNAVGNAPVTRHISESESEPDVKPKAKDKPPLPPAGGDALPVNLASPAFRTAWAEWDQHRREKRQALTPTAKARQLAKLSEWGESRAIAAIQHSIGNGWTGIFEDKHANGQGQSSGQAGNGTGGTSAGDRRRAEQRAGDFGGGAFTVADLPIFRKAR